MNEAIKLDRIKNSCKAGKIVTLIFTIFAIVGCVLSLIGGIAILSSGEKFDNMMIEAKDEGYVSANVNIGTARVFGIDITDPENFETDLPAVQEALNNHPYSTMYGMLCIVISFLCAGLAVLLKLLESVFTLIEREGSPFTEKVVKRVLIAMIIFSVIMFLGSGLGAGLICGILTWVVYTVLDYGKTLQDQYNETL